MILEKFIEYKTVHYKKICLQKHTKEFEKLIYEKIDSSKEESALFIERTITL